MILNQSQPQFAEWNLIVSKDEDGTLGKLLKSGNHSKIEICQSQQLPPKVLTLASNKLNKKKKPRAISDPRQTLKISPLYLISCFLTTKHNTSNMFSRIQPITGQLNIIPCLQYMNSSHKATSQMMEVSKRDREEREIQQGLKAEGLLIKIVKIFQLPNNNIFKISKSLLRLTITDLINRQIKLRKLIY
ncbi:hypothetical protein FGO68_gene12082 [Halteria grandinella]|uniref:Uncharacterized protein n=1 Tax=Halteria grandinella TaxID=5974 RepID=A0A8J8P4X8_HALGN|nr:hypothetical protein FGO68_gene12082 [Halteria grandinella]